MNAADLRNTFVDGLVDQGLLSDPAWEQAARTVPREAFLRTGYFAAENTPGAATHYRPVLPDAPGWLEGAYSNTTLVTQLNGSLDPTQGREQIEGGVPTSSSTLPSLVLRMWQDLQAADGHRVLEIGTGTGYSTALGCARLGEDRVTSVEVDPEVAARAAEALQACGFHPELVVGDGLAGHKPGAPYDRVIATCEVTTIPAAWVEQTRPGGIVLATVGGWMHASELARLTVQDNGTARGRLLPGHVSFMLARPQMPPPFGLLPDLDAGDEEPTDLPGDALDDWTVRFVAQTAAPTAQRLVLPRNGRTEHVLLDVGAGAWAAVYGAAGGWRVRQGGPARLWDQVAGQVARWRADGAPPLDRFEITVSPDSERITWPSR